MIRQDFQSLPPKMYLLQITDDLTKVYCFLWEKKDKINKVYLNWKDLSRYFQKNCFRSNLRKLNNQALLNYEENPDGVTVELIGWDDIIED